MARRFVAGLSGRRFGFDPRSVHVRCVVDIVHWDRFFSEYFDIPLSVSVYQYSIFIYMWLLRKGQTDEAWQFPKEAILFRKSERIVLGGRFTFSVFKGLIHGYPNRGLRAVCVNCVYSIKIKQ
jgi:hypothetical protein